MKICNLVRTYARVVRNRVFYEDSSLQPVDSLKNPVSWGLMRPGILELIAILLRIQTDDFAEGLAKVTLVFKPDLLRDICYGKLGLF